MDTVEIDIPFGYSCHATIKGSRTAAWRHVRETMRVEVRSLRRDEVDAMAEVADPERHSEACERRHRKIHGLPFAGLPVVAGRLLHPVVRRSHHVDARVVDLAGHEGLVADAGAKLCLGLAPNPFRLPSGGDVAYEFKPTDNLAKTVPAANLRDVGRNGRPAAVAAALRYARDLAFVDGRMFTGTHEPVLVRAADEGRGSIAWIRPDEIYSTPTTDERHEIWRLDKALDRFGDRCPLASVVPLLTDLRVPDFDLGLGEALRAALLHVYGDSALLELNSPTWTQVPEPLDEACLMARRAARSLRGFVERGEPYDRRQALDALSAVHAALVSLDPADVRHSVTDLPGKVAHLLRPQSRLEQFEATWTRIAPIAGEDDEAAAFLAHR